MDNHKIQCACGCGEWLYKYAFGRGFKSDKRERKYINGHNRRGNKHTEESKNKMSLIQKEIFKIKPGNMAGKYHSEETKKKISMGNLGKIMPRGEKCVAWRGGVTSESRLERIRFRCTLQKKIFERDNYICQICGIKGGSLHVHHINSWTIYPEQRFLIDNCLTICARCHYEKTFSRPMPNNINDWGNNLAFGGVLP